ncbi:hypothetical protein B0H67DRAFT_547781 [Lasiosphaeris hirsuta]|uniref:Uncharacterized protein n=1 Tax=Lasiosphaeris hirsuta TaxID=260670 RepID=A0AA40E657_9PEZI|nr:hypothetical protein B0H67DRAFT_547781 [Lasiosphaeris hirsuta]
MGGRGRGRGPTRQSAEPTAPPAAGRRSTRQQQQQLDPQIDPAITTAQAADMPPPPIPSSRRAQSQEKDVSSRVADVARRGTRRDTRAESIASVNSLPTSSQLEGVTQIQSLSHARPASLGRGMSVISSSSTRNDTPSQIRARAKLMKKFLPRLSDASDDLFAHLKAAESTDEEEWQDEHSFFSESFATYRGPYVSEPGDVVIDADYVHSSLGVERKDPLWSKSSRIICIANLTSIMNLVTTIKQGNELPLLQVLHRNFPQSIIPSDPGAYDNLESIGAQLIEIRTYLLIYTLKTAKQNESNRIIHPYEWVLKDFFVEGTLEDLRNFMQSHTINSLRPKPMLGLEIEMGGWLGEHIFNRVRSICIQLPDEEVLASSLDFSAIDNAYHFQDNFLSGLRLFISQRYTATKASLEPIPAGIDSQIQSQLEADAQGHSSDGVGAVPESGYLGPLRAMAMLAQDGHGALDRLASEDIIERSHQIQSSAYPPVSSAPYGFEPLPVTYGEPPSAQGFQSNGSMYAESAAQVTRKRRRGTDVDAQANGGTEGQAPTKKPRGKRKKAIPRPSLDAAASSNTFVGTPVEGSQYPPPPNSQAEPDFDAVSQRSKEISAANRKAREPQVRSSWVRNDIHLLVKAVDIFKCKWSLIEKEIKAGTIKFEIPRDQQALRDKARLLKQDFLKADVVLPPSFDLVVLGKKERNAVIACGKNPDRREADVEDGQPINTEYVPDDAMSAPARAQEALNIAPEIVAEAATQGTVPEAPMDAPIDMDADSEVVAA